MHYQRVKTFETNSSAQLEREVNRFISRLDRAPLKMTFYKSEKYIEGDSHPWPRHVAHILYIDNIAFERENNG